MPHSSTREDERRPGDDSGATIQAAGRPEATVPEGTDIAPLTRGERAELQRIVKARARLSKSQLEAHGAIPTPAQLLPALDVDAIESATPIGRAVTR